MKKLMLTGFMGVMLAVPAFATEPDPNAGSLTTKGYVDDGLRAVYGASKGYTDTIIGNLPTDVANLKTTVNCDGTNLGLNEIVKGNGTTTTGLVGDIATLDNQINGNGTTTFGLAGDVDALDKQINGDGTNMGLDEQINGNGTTTTGLAGDVAALQQTVGDASTPDTLAYKVNQLESSSTVYTPGNGINIDTANNNTISVKAGDGLTFDATSHEVTIDGLATTQETANQDKMYIYKNGALSEMPVQTTWDPNFDFDPND